MAKKRKNADGLKCRERLAVEAYIQQNKKPREPLTFSAKDVVANSGYRLNANGVLKAIHNMVYFKAGVQKTTARGVYLVRVDSHPAWSKDTAGALARAQTSRFQKRAVGRPHRVAARRATATTQSQANSKPVPPTIVNTIAPITTKVIDAAAQIVNTKTQANFEFNCVRLELWPDGKSTFTIWRAADDVNPTKFAI